MEIIKGRTLDLTIQIFDDIQNKQPANLTGATVRYIIKKSRTDLDDNAITSGQATVTDAANGLAKVVVADSIVNLFPQQSYMEIVALLSTGKRISSIGKIETVPNVYNELFPHP